jgi:NAD(P)-dependent dehydrogenase (short-subunit alcohol dehydrogenase family)
MAASSGTALIVGASRGLGLGLAGAFLKRGWDVVATARGAAIPPGLAALKASSGDRLEIERVDIGLPDEVSSLRERLAGRSLDLLFIVAGIGSDESEKVATTPLDAFVKVMATNAYWPVRFAEGFADLVTPTGTIALMTSQLGSLTRNTFGGYESYRASKAALNMMTLSAAPRWGAGRTVLLVHPGWVRTDMGGPNAPLDLETSVTGMVDTIETRSGRTGVGYVDWENRDLPW